MNTSPGFIAQQIDQRSTAMGQQVLETAANIHRVAEQLRNDAVTEKAAQLAETIASATEKVGHYLENSDVNTMLHDAEDYSRQQPLMVVLGGLVLGFSASRLLKAGAARRSVSRSVYASQ